VLSLAIWWVGICLESIILLRGISGKTISKYPFFFAYIACSLAGNVVLYAVSIFDPSAYTAFYWPVQSITLLLGCGILLEIFKHVLSDYPGAEKFAVTSGLITVGAVICFAVIYPLVARSATAGTAVELERDLRTVQAIFLVVILAITFYYGIRLGWDMKGMILGYGLYVQTSLLTLAVRAYAGPTFVSQAWKVLQPLSYDVSVLIWALALWSHYEKPVSSISVRIDTDYETLALSTKSAIGAMRSHLEKAARP